MSEQIPVVGAAKLEKATCKWEIKNFSKVFCSSNELSKKIQSPKFEVIINGRLTEWKLGLARYTDSKPNFATLYAKYCTEGEAYVNMSFTFVRTINNKIGTSAAVFIGYFVFRKDALSTIDVDVVSRNVDSLTIVWEIILDKTRDYDEKIKNGRVEDFDFQDYSMLYNNKRLSDVILMVKDGESQRKFYAHKHILAKRSSVFEAMFRHQEMLENQNKQVNIVDISPKAMIRMLRYIYSADSIFCRYDLNSDLCEIRDNFTEILETLKVADKYALDVLKKEYEIKLCSNLKLEHAIEVLTIADQCNAKNLKAKAIELIANNVDILKGQEFETLTELHPQVVAEIFKQISSNMKKTKRLNSSLSLNSSSGAQQPKMKRQRYN